MNFKLKIFLISAFAACVLILPRPGVIYVADENMSDYKTPVNIDNEKTEILSEAEKNKKKRMETHKRKELLRKTESSINANNKSYTLIYVGIFFAVLIYAYLTLRVKEAILVQKQNGMNSKKQ